MQTIFTSRWASTGSVDLSIFEKALDALPDGVLLVNSRRRVVYANAAFARIWAIPAQVMASKSERALLRVAMEQLVNPAEFLREVERLHPMTDTTEDEILFRDGRTIERRSLPFEEDGQFSARIWIFTDVTEAKQACIDQLTGLPNRLAFSRQFPPFVTAPSDGLVRAVAMVDVDNFKRYNDSYGHASGDDVLKRIGALFRKHNEGTGDLVFRIGGEEFLMATRIRHSDEAAVLFDRIRHGVMAMEIGHNGNASHGVVTVSIGYQSFPTADDAGAIFKNVDDALYRAKAGGRNSICEATPCPGVTSSPLSAPHNRSQPN